MEGLSSSYFYYLSRLFHKKLGNNGDKLLEGICINKACEYRNDSPGNGSIISIYRKYKSKITKNKYEKEYKEEYRKNLLNDSEGYGDDGTICPICFEFKRNIIALAIVFPFKYWASSSCSFFNIFPNNKTILSFFE